MMVSLPRQPESLHVRVLPSEESEATSMDHVKASLFNHLASIEEARTWCSYGPVLVNSPTPGLYLKDGDIVGLPLSPHDALRIKRQASPHDKNGSLACELSPGQFEVRNPAWHAFVQTVGSNGTKPFDIGPVGATLRKLVLSDNGSGSAVQEQYAHAHVLKERV